MGPYRLKDYLLCIHRLPPLGAEELALAWERWGRGDERARRLIEERHLGHVLAWVQAYRGAGLGLMGLIECGNRALLRSLRRRPELPLESLQDFLRTAVEEEIESRLMARRA